MQTRQSDRKIAPKAPRRARRGALMPAALLAVLVITLLLSQFASAQLRQARAARVEARAMQLAAIAADFDYYVHDRREDIAQEMCSTQPGLGGNSDFHTITVDPAEFEPDYLRSGVTPRIPGFTLQYIADCRRHGHDILGILELTPESAQAEADMTAILARLARHGVEERGVISTSFGDDGSSRSIWTAPLSGVNPAYVLRMRRAGHPPPRLVGAGALDLGGHNSTNIGSITAMGGEGSAAETLVGDLRVREMGGTLVSLRHSPEGQERFGRDGNTLHSLRIDTLPAAGSLTLAGNAMTAGQVIAGADISTLVYTPPADTTGTVTFTFSLSDGTAFGATATATVRITTISEQSRGGGSIPYTGGRDGAAPASSGQGVTTQEDTPYRFKAEDFAFADAAPPGDVKATIAGTTRAEAMIVDSTLTSGGLRLRASDGDDGGLTVDGTVLAGDWVKTDVLRTDAMTATRLTAQSTALTGAATVDDVLSADRLHSPDVTVRDDFNAGQVFTKEADIRDLEVRGACHGC